jgi:hypothetical protein
MTPHSGNRRETQQTLRNSESLSQNNCVDSQPTLRTAQAGVARRAE